MPRVEPVHFTYTTELKIDAVYFHAARRAHQEAIDAQTGIEAARTHWSSLDEEWDRIEASEPDPARQYDLLEPVAVQMEHADYQIGEAYGPYIKAIATVHILSTAALEAHINAVAKERLSGVDYNHMERLALEAKWLFLPRLLGVTPFDPGRQPFQGFSRTVKLRDKLVHYKGIKEEWVSGQPPAFLSDLGLTIEDSDKAISSARNMIAALSTAFGSEQPYWLRGDVNKIDYFDFNVESKSAPRSSSQGA